MPALRKHQCGQTRDQRGRQNTLYMPQRGLRKTFQDDYAHRGYEPRTHSDIYFLTVNGNGVRATARSLGISKDTVISSMIKVKRFLKDFFFWQENFRIGSF